MDNSGFIDQKEMIKVMSSIYIMLEPRGNKSLAVLQASAHAARIFRWTYFSY